MGESYPYRQTTPWSLPDHNPLPLPTSLLLEEEVEEASQITRLLAHQPEGVEMPPKAEAEVVVGEEVAEAEVAEEEEELLLLQQERKLLRPNK